MPAPATDLLDWLKSWPLAMLPHHLLSRMVRSATRWRVRWWKNLLITWFIRVFRVDMQDALDPSPGSYPNFNSFFVRQLKPGARPLPDTPDAIACPADGFLSEAGEIRNGRLIQAKGRDYSLRALLGGNATRAAAFEQGKFATIYLSPRDYHRVHMPCSGNLTGSITIPGRLFSVAPHTTRAIPNLFTRNERIAALFETPSGPAAIIMVGAIFVACMETVWEDGSGTAQGPGIHTRHFGGPSEDILTLQRGDEMGRFNMGSTVILLFGPGQVEWASGLAPGQVLRMGQAIGHFTNQDP